MDLQAHESLKNEQDSTIRQLFSRYNLGPLPSTPFGNEEALNFTKRIKSRLLDLEQDLQDKKVDFLFFDLEMGPYTNYTDSLILYTICFDVV